MIDIKRLLEIANDNVEDILSALSLDYIKDGGYVCCKCVFHENADGYNLRYRNGFWYCFSHCHRKYSTINVVQKVLDLDFKEACQWLCNELGIDSKDLVVNEQKLEIKSKLNKLKSMKGKKEKVVYKPVGNEILSDIDDYIHPYMVERGFKRKTLEHFGVGYARTGFFTNRITIPIDAPNGEIMSISGRLPNATELGLPKYKLLKGVDVSTTLYNISRIDKSKGYVVVVEGFMSVFSLYEYGITNVVALMGANLSDIQRNIILSLGCKIIIAGDNDEAGQRLNQQVYNKCSKYTEVIKLDIGRFTDVEKASPCEEDVGFDSMCDLVDEIERLAR